MNLVKYEIVRAVIVAAVAVGLGWAQQTGEKRVREIRSEQRDDVVGSSRACQRVKETGHVVFHTRDVSSTTLEPDLYSLMEKSDEVVLVGFPTGDITTLSPLGEDVIHYYDATVLRIWKGSHKVGDTLTYAIPQDHIQCPGILAAENSTFATFTGGIGNWKPLWGPQILFLRQSRGNEIGLTPGLRPTGGDGVQGVFDIPFPLPTPPVEDSCAAVLRGTVQKCNAILETSDIPILIPYRLDPLIKQYDGLPVANFLREIRSVAESQGLTEQNQASK